MDLTTLARTKQYLLGSQVPVGADLTYSQLISSASASACQYCSRSFQTSVYNNLRLNGTGTDRQAMPNNPIISVSSLLVDGGAAIPISPDGRAVGYQFDQKFLYLFGGRLFSRGTRNVAVGFTAGYRTAEVDFIPAVPPYVLSPHTGSGVDPFGLPDITSGPAISDQGVVFQSTGISLVRVGAAPATGQYSFSSGAYTFAAADAGIQVAMTYDYVPSDVEMAVINTIGTWMKARDNLGIASVSLAGETISYRDQALSKSAKALLDPYRWILVP